MSCNQGSIGSLQNNTVRRPKFGFDIRSMARHYMAAILRMAAGKTKCKFCRLGESDRSLLRWLEMGDKKFP